MSDLADLIRSKAPDLSNRQIAERAGLRPGTVDRVMNGVGQPKVETVDKIARALKIPVERAREAAGKPRGSSEPYAPPAEARLLDQRQRQALDELIRSVTSMQPGAGDRSLFLAKLAHMDGDRDHLMYRARLAYNTNDAKALLDLVAEVESEVLDDGWPLPSWRGQGPNELSDSELLQAAAESADWDAFLRTKRPDLFEDDQDTQDPPSDPPAVGEARTGGPPVSEPHGGHSGVGMAKDPLWQEYDETKSQSPQEM